MALSGVREMWTTGQSAGSLHPNGPATALPAMALPAMALPMAKGDVEIYSVMLDEVYFSAGFHIGKRRSLSLPGLVILSTHLALCCETANLYKMLCHLSSANNC